MKAEDESPPIVSDHIFEATVPWGRCQRCGLARAAHENAPSYPLPPLPYRCPRCVEIGRKVCPHGRRRPEL